jgi:hypothetical protein
MFLLTNYVSLNIEVRAKVKGFIEEFAFTEGSLLKGCSLLEA